MTHRKIDETTEDDFKDHCCRVCGAYYPGYYPWGKDGQTPLFDICQCCNVEFGYEDIDEKNLEEFRAKWIAAGPVWHDAKTRPENWDPAKQLENILDTEQVRQLLK